MLTLVSHRALHAGSEKRKTESRNSVLLDVLLHLDYANVNSEIGSDGEQPLDARGKVWCESDAVPQL
jgi:hypothetical protein